jgi:hypothetical protein
MYREGLGFPACGRQEFPITAQEVLINEKKVEPPDVSGRSRVPCLRQTGIPDNGSKRKNYA